jgi:hypothetical protein
MQNFEFLWQPLLGDWAISSREREKMPFIVATYVYASSQGQRTHSLVIGHCAWGRLKDRLQWSYRQSLFILIFCLFHRGFNSQTDISFFHYSPKPPSSMTKKFTNRVAEPPFCRIQSFAQNSKILLRTFPSLITLFPDQIFYEKVNFCPVWSYRQEHALCVGNWNLLQKAQKCSSGHFLLLSIYSQKNPSVRMFVKSGVTGMRISNFVRCGWARLAVVGCMRWVEDFRILEMCKSFEEVVWSLV